LGDRARAHSAFQQAVRSLGYKEETDWYQSPLRDLAGVISLAYEAGETGIARSLQARLENAVARPRLPQHPGAGRLLQAAYYMLRASGRCASRPAA
jgi:uncharacterized protein YfaS (alpha-2-macroglobulin family)